MCSCPSWLAISASRRKRRRSSGFSATSGASTLIANCLPARREWVAAKIAPIPPFPIRLPTV